ncbi:MAG: ABC transporter permease [Candidatus Latescibacterota bacterium]|jgi:peptide/nickel transport system permease protein
MFRYTLQRLLLAIPTLLGITVISFLVMRLAPGDPVDLFLGGAAGGEGISTDRRADLEKTRQELRHQLGLDQSLHRQYLSWLANLVLRLEPLDPHEQGARLADLELSGLEPAERQALAALEPAGRKARFIEYLRRVRPAPAAALGASPFWQGNDLALSGNYRYQGTGIELFVVGQQRAITLNLGRSFKDQQPVVRHLLERLPVTLEINAIGLLLAYLIGVPLGVLLAARQDTWLDRTATAGTFVLWSMPSFWVGMLLIMFLCNQEFLYWFPASGIRSLEAAPEWGWWRSLTDHAHHLVLPVLASSYASFAGISRYMRTSMLENLRLDYVRTARAKGLGERAVLLRHVLRNSLIPIVTLMAGLLPGMIAGSVFIETIFTIPGMGFLAFQSVIGRDYPMAMAIFTIGAALSLLGILVADVLLKVVDPRIDFTRVQG